MAKLFEVGRDWNNKDFRLMCNLHRWLLRARKIKSVWLLSNWPHAYYLNIKLKWKTGRNLNFRFDFESFLSCTSTSWHFLIGKSYTMATWTLKWSIPILNPAFFGINQTENNSARPTHTKRRFNIQSLSKSLHRLGKKEKKNRKRRN